MRVSEDMMVKALARANFNRRAAVQLELAVGMVAFLLYGKDAKKKLYDIYEAADHECRPGEADYKTVNRRINASEKLFDRVTREKVATLVQKKRDMSAIHAVARHLVEINVCTIDDVLEQNKRQRRPKSEPQRRRWTDEERENAFRIQTEHVSIVIPPTITRVEMMELALKIAEIADSMNGKIAA